MRRRLASAFCKVLVLLVPGALLAQATRPPALRAVPTNRAFELRVLYLEDPRLPTLEGARRMALYGKLSELLRTWYGYDATLREVRQHDLAGYFAARASLFRKYPEIVRMRIDPDVEGGRARLRATIRRALQAPALDLIAEHLQVDQVESRQKAVDLAYDRFVQRLPEILAVPANDGEPLANPQRPELNSYVHWCVLTYEMSEADIVFTNSLVAGADEEMGLTQIGRGGVTTGNTNANRHNTFGAGVVVTMFPFLSDAPFWLRERGAIPEDQRLDVIATLAMHELGHMLQRVADHARHPHCVYVPPVGLRYYDWHRAIREGGRCTLEHRRLEHY